MEHEASIAMNVLKGVSASVWIRRVAVVFFNSSSQTSRPGNNRRGAIAEGKDWRRDIEQHNILFDMPVADVLLVQERFL